jgi:hypothetical protein
MPVNGHTCDSVIGNATKLSVGAMEMKTKRHLSKMTSEPSRASEATTFRHAAGFGKRIEYWIIGEMLKEGLDVYVPLVDDDAIDAVIRRRDGTFITVQIKARSRTVGDRADALFAAIPHEPRNGYWFVFYSERMDTKWIMTSDEFIREAFQNKSGKNKGKRSIWLNGWKKDKATGRAVAYCKKRFERYIAKDYQKLQSNP